MSRKLLSLIFLIVMLTGCANSPAATAVVVPSTNTTEVTTFPISQQTNSGFTLTSTDVIDGGRLPTEYTCDGDGSALPLAWNGAPADAKSFAVIMSHNAPEGVVHWYWVLYNIPADVTSLPKNVSGVGTLGNNINNGLVEYSPPCSKGPGDKTYTYTVYALSAEPQISVPAEQVTRDVLLAAIKDITLASAELNVVYARQLTDGTPQSSSTQAVTDQSANQAGGGTPPQVAYDACTGQAEQASCSFTDQNGDHTGVCETVQGTLACSPKLDVSGEGVQGTNPPGNLQKGGNPTADGADYNIEQAISDKAQGMTISYDALAFMTGDLGSDSFFPPGKVADFWGFQYLRDNDSSEMGHAGDFLTSAAMNTLTNLTADQRAQLVALAQSQVDDINEYGYKRFVLMDAFRRLASGDLPVGTTALDEEAVKAYSADLYKLDGQISFERAQLMGKIITSLSADQKAYFDAMAGKGMKEWNTVEEPEDIRGLDRDVKVAVMTYAADLYSWYAGSVEADVYFCPERHGTYFGSFYLKDIKAMSDPTYAIPTNLTGDLGETMLQKLTSDQAQLVTSLVETQKPSLQGIVSAREQISKELRKFKEGGAADQATMINLMAQYGAYDGELIYNMAVNFAAVKHSLTSEQQAELDALRTELLGDQSHPTGAYLYSQAIPMPEIPNTDFLFK
jgi:Raf kinase inhibitor-like YbhB/YbcL family protein